MKSLQLIACSFHRIIKGAGVIEGVLPLLAPPLSLSPSALTDCVFVRLTVAPFVSGIKSLRGATRSDWESWGKKKRKKEDKTTLSSAALY